jgi:hypothetical protein
MIDFGDMLPWITVVGSAGAAWGGVQVSVSATKTKVTDAVKALARHEEKDSVIHIEMVDRLARIETKLDALIEGK